MGVGRLVVALLFASACASSDPILVDSVPPPAASVIPIGQPANIPTDAPAVVPSGQVHERRGLDAYFTAYQRDYVRVFADTTGELEVGASEQYAIPIQRGRCYRVFLSGTGEAFDLRARLYDHATLVEEDRAYDRLVNLGVSRSTCADRTGLWRLEVTRLAGGRRHTVSVLIARTAPNIPTLPPPEPSPLL